MNYLASTPTKRPSGNEVATRDVWERRVVMMRLAMGMGMGMGISLSSFVSSHPLFDPSFCGITIPI